MKKLSKVLMVMSLVSASAAFASSPADQGGAHTGDVPAKIAQKLTCTSASYEKAQVNMNVDLKDGSGVVTGDDVSAGEFSITPNGFNFGGTTMYYAGMTKAGEIMHLQALTPEIKAGDHFDTDLVMYGAPQPNYIPFLTRGFTCDAE